MKRKETLILLAATLITITSCQKLKDEANKATEFDISYTSEVNVPAAKYDTSGTIAFTSDEISTQSSEKFAAEKTAKDLITEIKLTNLKMSADVGNFDHIKSFSVSISATGMAETQVAVKNAIPAGVNSVAADLMDVNIRDYIVKDKIRFKTVVSFKPGNIPAQKLKTEETVHAKASLLN
jgi:hypothetical protein